MFLRARLLTLLTTDVNIFLLVDLNVQNAQKQVEPILQSFYRKDVPYCISQILFALRDTAKPSVDADENITSLLQGCAKEISKSVLVLLQYRIVYCYVWMVIRCRILMVRFSFVISVCLSVCLSICLSVCMYECMYVCMYVTAVSTLLTTKGVLLG